MSELPSTREVILDAAAERFSQKGFHATSIDEIAAAAGVAKGSIYYHFAGKDDILVTIVEDGCRYILQAATASAAADAGAASRLCALLKRHLQVYAAYYHLAKLAGRPPAADIDPKLRSRIALVQADYVRVLRELIAYGVERGEFAVQDAALAAELILAAIDCAATYWMERRGTADEVPLAAVEEQLLRSVTSGLTTAVRS